MYRIGLLLLLALSACTERAVRSGALVEQADFLPTFADTFPSDPSAGGLGDGERPRMILRCEAGRVGAYLVVATAAEVDSGWIDDRAVRVELDSAPTC